MKAQRLTGEELKAALAQLSDWSCDAQQTALRKQYRFADFNQAFAFMCRVAMQAEKLDHHPDWSNAYNRVDVALTTHSAGGLTSNDLALARFCDSAA